MYKIYALLLVLLLPACYKETAKVLDLKEKTNGNKQVKELDFKAFNNTQATLYITCFYYAMRDTSTRWMWYKTPIYELKPKATALVDIHTILSESEIPNIYGYLAIFLDKDSAENSIFELLPDEQKIDLPKLHTLHNKVLFIQTEAYGFRGTELDWEIKNKNQIIKASVPELDFLIENQTEQDLLVTCFAYQKKEYHPQWRFDKTNIIRINSGESKVIDVDSITNKEDRNQVSGYLGIFKIDKEKEARESTFELLKQDQKISIGKLKNFKNKKVVIIPKRYGVLAGFDDRHPYLEYEAKKLTSKEKSITKK